MEVLLELSTAKEQVGTVKRKESRGIQNATSQYPQQYT